MRKPTDDKQFETMVRDCAEMKFQTDFFLLGKNGQTQYGGDVASVGWETIIQCKCFESNRGKAAYSQLITNIKGTTKKKGDYERACSHFYEMKRFVIATTLDRDLLTQEEIRAIENKIRKIERKIPIVVFFWEDLVPLYEAFEDKYKLNEIRRELSNTLQADRNCNPSFTLMKVDKIDRLLYPGLEETENFTPVEVLAEKSNSEPVSPVWERIRNTWNADENHSIVIEGAGGIGKTVALFSLSTANRDYSPAPAIYIPMHKLIDRKGNSLSISEYLKVKFPYLYLEIDQLARRRWIGGPRLLLLLDGFNEIPGNRRQELLSTINEWRQVHTGTQLIAVSRPVDNINLLTELEGNPLSIKLKPLCLDTVCAYLKSWGVEPPPAGSPVWKNLVYPLFLVLYVKTGMLEKQSNSGYAILLRDANGGGSIIWNYLQREMLKKENESWVIQCAVVCEYILPYIAYHMLSEYRYTITSMEIDCLTVEALTKIDPNRLPNHLRDIIASYKRYHHNRVPSFSVKTDDEKEKWCDVVLRDSGILVPFDVAPDSENNNIFAGRFDSTSSGSDLFAFLHQNFRDCLAGIHLINYAESMDADNFPDVWSQPISNLALDYAAELLSPKEYIKLWNANSHTLQHNTQRGNRNHLSTCNLLDLYMRNDKLANDLNFSGMDLRGLSLTRYLGKSDHALPLLIKPNQSKDTVLDQATFQSNGHLGSIAIIAVLADGRVISGSYDSTLRIWDASTGQCLQILKGHTGAINCVAVLSNGRVASGSDDRTLRVWDVNSGKCLRILRGHSGEVRCITVISNDRVVSGSKDNTLRVWDIKTGKCLHELEGHTQAVSCVAAFPNNRVVSGSYDKTIRVWDVVKGQCLQCLVGHLRAVSCLIILPKKLLVSGSNDSTLRVWDVVTGACLHTLTGHTDGITCLTILEDGRIVSGSRDGTLRVWDSTTQHSQWCLKGHANWVTCMSLFPDGRLVSGSYDHTLKVWNTSSGQLLQTLNGHTKGVNSVAVLPNGRIASGSFDHALCLWDVTSGECVLKLENHANRIYCVDVLPNGLIVVGLHDHTLRVWDVNLGHCLHTLKGHTDRISCLIVLSDDRVVSGSYDHTLRVWDTTTGQCLQTMKGHTSWINCIAALSKDVVISGSDDNSLRVWNTVTGQCLQTLEGHTHVVDCVAAFPDGRVVSGSGDSTLRIWDAMSGKSLKILKGHTSMVNCVRLLSNDQVVSGSRDGTLRVWDAATGYCQHILKGHSHAVTCVTVLSNSRVVSASFDRTLRVWDIAKGESQHVLKGHTSWVNCVAVLPNGHLVSGSNDQTLRVWNPDTSQCLKTLTSHASWITCVAAFPDNRVASGSYDNTLRIWDPNTGECLDILEAMDVCVSEMNVSEAFLTDQLARLLWHNRATISERDYQRWVKPFRKQLE